MERDCLIGHGTEQVLKERLFEQSDPYRIYICDGCGFIAVPPKPNNTQITGMLIRGDKPYCKNCKSGERVEQISIPYAAKLMFQELMAMGLAPRLFLSKTEESNSMQIDIPGNHN